MSRWKNAFKIEHAKDFVPSERETEMIDKFAGWVCRRGLALPGILFLETFRPMNFVSSQGLAFFEPIVRSIFDWEAYSDFWKMLERRGSVEALISAIEAIEGRRTAAQHAAKQEKRAARLARRQKHEKKLEK